MVCEDSECDFTVCKPSEGLLTPCPVESKSQRWYCPVQSRVEGHLLLDPTEDETYQEDGGLLLAYMPQANLVGCLLLHYSWSPLNCV